MDLRQALRLFLIVLVAVLCFVALWFLVDFMALPSPFGHVLRVVLVVLAVLVGIGFLMRMVGSSPPSDGGGGPII